MRATLVPQPRESVVIAGIERELAPLEMENVVDDVVEEIALVADHDEAAAIGLEERFEPERRLEIEMVRRLVEQQQVRLREQQSGEGDAHAPAAGER